MDLHRQYGISVSLLLYSVDRCCTFAWAYFLIPGISRIRINGCRYVYIVGRMQMKELFGRAGFEDGGMWPSNNRHWSLCRVLIIIHSWPLLSSLSLFCSVCDWKAHRPEDRSILNRNETTTTIGRDMQIRWYHQIFSFGGIVVVLLPLPLVHSDFGPKKTKIALICIFSAYSQCPSRADPIDRSIADERPVPIAVWDWATVLCVIFAQQ